MNDGNLRLVIGSNEQQRLKIGSGDNQKNALQLGGAFPVWEKDYEKLKNKPKINGITLEGDKTSRQLRIKETDPLTNLEIEAMLAEVFN